MELWICPLKENMNKFMSFQAGVYYPSLIFVRLLYCLCSVQPMYMCRLLWFFFFFFKHSVWKLSVQLAIYQAKLLLINSALILFQSHHMYSQMRNTAYTELSFRMSWSCKSCFSKESVRHVANADIEEPALPASYYPCVFAWDYCFH